MVEDGVPYVWSHTNRWDLLHHYGSSVDGSELTIGTRPTFKPGQHREKQAVCTSNAAATAMSGVETPSSDLLEDDYGPKVFPRVHRNQAMHLQSEHKNSQVPGPPRPRPPQAIALSQDRPPPQSSGCGVGDMGSAQ